MAENELNSYIKDFYSKKLTDVKIYLIFRNIDDQTGEYIYESCYFGIETIGKGLSDFLSYYENRINQTLYKKDIVKYDVAVSEKGNIEKIEVRKVPNIEKVNKVLNPLKSEKISHKKFDPIEIWGYAIKLTNKDDENFTTYRKHIGGKAFTENKILNITTGKVKLEEPDDMLMLDFKVDAIKIGDLCYVISDHYFNQFFSFTEAHEEFVDSNVNSLKELDLIDNFDEFHLRCKDSSNLVKRLVNVVKNDRFNWLKKNYDAAKTVASDYKLKIDFDEDTGRINYNEKKCNVTDVITLLAGCCVEDAIDREKYIASSVRKIS